MSQAILKRCLELVEEDLPSASSSKKAKKQSTNKSKHSLTKQSSIFDMIPERQRLTITKKEGKNQKKQVINKIKPTEKFTVKQAQNKIKRNKDRTEENVRRLLALDRELNMNNETKELLIRRARTGHYVIPEQKPVDQDDVFTEEDFAKFEREYFCK